MARLSRLFLVVGASALLAVSPTLLAQRPSPSSSSSSSNGDEQEQQAPSSTVVPRRADAAGSAISLEDNESLFQVAAALNVCGYDNGLETSLPVRSAVRADMAAAIAASAEAKSSRDALCAYINGHEVNGAANLAQYVSLALFLAPPPQLELSVPELDMPPDALQVEGVLPLLRTFAQRVELHGIFVRHRAAYEAAVTQVRDSLTKTLLETNVYLHQPVSSYDGRRFAVLLEPMLSPQAVNARVYGNDYFLAVSPADLSKVQPDKVSVGARMKVDAHAGGLQMDRIRHVYMLYTIDPIIYSRAAATGRLGPVLRVVQDAPLDFIYKNDIVALATECLIKAIEARTMDVGFDMPAKPSAVKSRQEIDDYNAAIIAYDRRAEAVRRKQVVVDEESGWVLTGAFYEQLSRSDREGVSLKESMGEMVYGMDVPHEIDHAKSIPFFKPDSNLLVGSGGVSRGRAPRRTLLPMDQAEMKLQNGDHSGAGEMAEKELAAHPDSGEALYVLARVNLMEGEPQIAFDRFQRVLTSSKDARTLGWTHVYLGRLYDAQQRPDRSKAVAEYNAALKTPGIQQDVQAAAEAGVRQPFAPPRRTAADSDQMHRDAQSQPTSSDDEDLDPTGRKQKESYRPGEETTPPAR